MNHVYTESLNEENSCMRTKLSSGAWKIVSNNTKYRSCSSVNICQQMKVKYLNGKKSIQKMYTACAFDQKKQFWKSVRDITCSHHLCLSFDHHRSGPPHHLKLLHSLKGWSYKWNIAFHFFSLGVWGVVGGAMWCFEPIRTSQANPWPFFHLDMTTIILLKFRTVSLLFRAVGEVWGRGYSKINAQVVLIHAAITPASHSLVASRALPCIVCMVNVKSLT